MKEANQLKLLNMLGLNSSKYKVLGTKIDCIILKNLATGMVGNVRF